MKPEIAYLSLKHKIIIASFVGPVLMIIARIIGADFWDGFAASGYTNSSLQNNLIRWGLWLPIIASVVAIILCINAARRFDHKEKRFITKLIPLAIFLPLTVTIACAVTIMLLFS